MKINVIILFITIMSDTCSHQRAPPVVYILLQPLRTMLQVVVLIVFHSSFILPLVFGDDSLLFGSSPGLCLQVQRNEVFSIKCMLIKTFNLISFIIPLTAVHILDDVNT